MKNKLWTLAIALIAALGIAWHEHRTDETPPQQQSIHAPEGGTGRQDASTVTDTNGWPLLPEMTVSRGGQVIAHTGFTLCYDADRKTPYWVAWLLTADRVDGTAPRYNKFMPDPAVRGAQAYTSDYTKSGYDRGHMAPAADMKWSETAMRESFYLSNVCPQNRNLNRGDWNDLEELTRQWARRFGTVSITAGPIYYTDKPARIGANRVAVPNAFFKVLLIGYPDSPCAYGFVFPNVAGNRPLTAYQYTVDEVERITGMDFFPALPDDVERRIEAEKPALP